MDRLERLAGRLAHDFNRLVSTEDRPESVEEMLEAACLVTELANELAASRSRADWAGDAVTPHAGPRVVLVVESEPEDRSALRQMLSLQGFRILEAATGAEALRICDSYAGPIDVLLTNVLIEDMSGREVAELAALSRQIEVIYMSGYVDYEIMSCGILGPDVAVLTKPVSASALEKKLDQVLAHQLVDCTG